MAVVLFPIKLDEDLEYKYGYGEKRVSMSYFSSTARNED
jgi:hypothetical protein